METIKINNKKKETCKGNALQVVSGGNFFERFVQSQKQGYQPDGSFKKKGITSDGAVNLREETCHILAHCNAHDAYNRFLRHSQIFEQLFVLINTKEAF